MNKQHSPAVQAALAVLDAQPQATEQAALMVAKCRALIIGYGLRWADSDYIPLEVETTIQTNLMNPATSRKSRNLKTAGKLDVVAVTGRIGVFTMQETRKTTLIDHKTCSEDIQDPAGSYWRQLVVESQPSHYMLLKWQDGEKIDEAMWDVLRKPSISPRQLKSKAERALAVSNREYCGQPLSDESMTWLQTNDRENLEMYEARLIDDCCNVRPAYYFQRRTIPRLDAELLEYAGDLWDAGQLIIEARRLNRYPKHPASCMAYGRPCQFLGICSGFDRPDSDRWTRKACVHSELPTIDGDGRDTITFSSVRTWQACPRKYMYRYEMGLERVDEEEAEALQMGHLWHLALEAYFRSLIPDEIPQPVAVSEPAEALPF